MQLLEARPTPSNLMRYGAPLMATVLMFITGTILFLGRLSKEKGIVP